MPLPSPQVHSLTSLPAIQSRTGTNALVLFDCRFAVSGRDMFTLTPNSPHLGRHFLRLYLAFLRRLPHHLALPSGEYRRLSSDQMDRGRGVLDSFGACPMVRHASAMTACNPR